jgi:hypothetical protein
MSLPNAAASPTPPARSAGPVAPQTKPRSFAPGDRFRRRRDSLVTRLWSAVARQIEDVERRSADLPGAANPERDAKVLAILCRVVRELAEDDEAAIKNTGRRLSEESAHAAHGPDLEEFRDDVARRLSRLREERNAAAGTAPAEPG